MSLTRAKPIVGKSIGGRKGVCFVGKAYTYRFPKPFHLYLKFLLFILRNSVFPRALLAFFKAFKPAKRRH